MLFERKNLPIQLKADSAGEFRAVFSTFDVVDHDVDVTRPGAFDAGKSVIVGSWGHKAHELPVGRGVIGQNEKEAWVEGKFFDTPVAQETYETVKALGDLSEWSYLYQPSKVSFGEFEGRQVRFLEEVKVFSVDPVLVGAGVNTRTTDIKSFSRDMPFVEHSAEIAELLGEWLARVKERAAIREKEGRMLSAANVERLVEVAESLKSIEGELEKLLSEADPKGEAPEPELVKEFLRSQRILAEMAVAR